SSHTGRAITGLSCALAAYERPVACFLLPHVQWGPFMQPLILALDQGTTSSRAILFGADGRQVAMAQQEFEQILPGPGEVEHDPEAIWNSQLTVAQQAIAKSGRSVDDVAAIGITNQRET